MARTSLSFSGILTLTRASTKTLFSAAGALASTAADTPAFNYVPTTGAALGQRLESAATNVAPTPSEPHNVLNLIVGGAVTANLGAAPDGTTTMARYILNSSTSTHYVGKANWSIATSGNTITYSVFVKNQGANKVRLKLYDHSDTANNIYATFDLEAGTKLDQAAAGTGSVVSAGIENYATGAYRLWITGVPAVGASNNIQARISAMSSSGTSENFLGDGVSGFDYWGINVCVSPLIQSFIPTAATRAVDIMRLATLSPYFYASKGAVLFDGRMPSTAPSGVKLQLFRFDDGTDDNVIEAYVPAGTANVEARIRSAGSTVFNQVAGTFTAGSVVKVRLSYAANAFAVALYGGVAVTGSSGAVPVGINAGYIGCSDVAGANSMNGDFQEFRYFPDSVSSGDLPLLAA